MHQTLCLLVIYIITLVASGLPADIQAHGLTLLLGSPAPFPLVAITTGSRGAPLLSSSPHLPSLSISLALAVPFSLSHSSAGDGATVED